jgi:hypothetical protein
MVRIDISQADSAFVKEIERAASRNERVIIERAGQAIAALVPIEDLENLERDSDAADGVQGLTEPAPDSTETVVGGTGESLLAMMEEVWKDVPDADWEKLPIDLAEQHDHYIYGLPKRKP